MIAVQARNRELAKTKVKMLHDLLLHEEGKQLTDKAIKTRAETRRLCSGTQHSDASRSRQKTHNTMGGTVHGNPENSGVQVCVDGEREGTDLSCAQTGPIS